MTTTGVSNQRLAVAALSVGFISAPVAYAFSILMERLSSPDDGANIGAGIFLLLATALFVASTVAFVVLLALRKLTTRQTWCVSGVAGVCFVLVSRLFFALWA
jgi:hypothetical protein